MKPQIKTHWQSQQCRFDVPTDMFIVEFGYKERDRITIRLQENDIVYLCYYTDTARYDEDKYIVVEVPFDMFKKKFKDFVKYLQGLTHEIHNETKCPK